MCNFLSVIVTKDGVIWHHPKESPVSPNQSHTAIIDHHKLHDSDQRFILARVEFVPPTNPSKIGDISEWQFKLDQDREPEWWQGVKDSVKTRLSEYVDGHVFREGKHTIKDSWAIGLGGTELLLENSQATLRGNSQATLWENSQATLRGNSQATLLENSQATLRGNSQATLWENSQATLRGNSQATLWENSQATLRGNSQATLWENSQATLRGNSQATLRGNSQATLRENSQATLWENSQANTRSKWGNQKVEVAERAVWIDWTTTIPTIKTGWESVPVVAEEQSE